MNSLIIISMTATAVGWTVAFGVFLYLLRTRWLARFERGFLISLLIALVGIALMSASVAGLWGYEAAKRTLDQELIVELQDVGGIVENEINRDITSLEQGLTSVGASVAPLIGHASAAELQGRLRTVQTFDPCFLQLALFDREDRLLTASSEAAGLEDASRMAVAFNLEGKSFVSDAHLSTIHKRQVVYVAVPVRAGGGSVLGSVGAWYDLQADLAELVGAARFNQSGYAVVVDGDGQIIAHPDHARLDENISSYPAVQRARQSDQPGAVTALNARKQSRLFGYRRIANPSTLGREPWVLLTEIDADEQLAPLLRVRRELALGIGLVLIAALIVARRVSHSIQRPLKSLGEFAQRIGTGDLTGRLCLSGRDVAGRLATTLNAAIYGDVSHGETLHHANIHDARVLVCTIPDSLLKGTTNTQLLRRATALAPHARVIVTAETFAGVRELYDLGASFVFNPRTTSPRELASVVVAAMRGDVEAQRRAALADVQTRAEVLP